MFLSGLMSSQRVTEAVRVEFDVVLARAWEAIATTHEQQAVTFVRRLASRIGTEDALHRYFREIAVPLQMRETVRARALLALTPEERHQAAPVEGDGLTLMRPDQLLSAVRRRSRYVEETSLAVRLAAAAADEALIATHVSMALESARVLATSMPADEALMQYLKAMALAPTTMQTVFQRSMARLADSDAMPVSMERDLEAASHTGEATPAPLRVLGLRAIS